MIDDVAARASADSDLPLTRRQAFGAILGIGAAVGLAGCGRGRRRSRLPRLPGGGRNRPSPTGE